MSCFRFLKDNYALSGKYANKEVSSENASFPYTNLEDIYRRKKVWRTAGYWDLSANDKTIVFRESVGVDLTATIAASSYSSDSAFLTAIKTALDAAGAATYTVSRDTTTNKIKILSNLGGGATVFQLRMADAASADMANAMGYDLVNLTGAASYIADELVIHSYEFVTWDLGIPTNPKHFILASDRNEALKLSPNAVIKLQGNETNNWTAPSYEATLEWHDYVLAVEDDDGLHTGPLRFWRLYIDDSANPLGYLEFGLVFLGSSFNPVRGGVQFGITGTYIDSSPVVFSEGGQVFADQRPKSESFGFDVSALTKADKEEFDTLFNIYGVHTPFFVSMDRDEAYSTSFQNMIRYVRFNSAPQHRLINLNNFTINVELREVL